MQTENELAEGETPLPRISVVTPSFNQHRFLRHAMQSVVGQGYPNLEYIVIDGGSTDNSQEIIEEHASRVAYWCSEPDGGHYEAVNKGFGRDGRHHGMVELR